MKINVILLISICLISTITVNSLLNRKAKSKKTKKLDPKTLEIEFQKNKKQGGVILTKNLKELFNSLYKGLKCKLHKKKKNLYLKFKKSVKKVTCPKDHVPLLKGGYYLSLISREIFYINEENIKNLPINLVKLILNLVLENGNNCQHLLKYYHFLKNEINNLKYLKSTNRINRGLLNKIKENKTKYFQVYGDYNKMGNILGNIIAYYFIYKPLSPFKQKALQMRTLMSLFKKPKESSKSRSQRRLNLLKKSLKYIK